MDKQALTWRSSDLETDGYLGCRGVDVSGQSPEKQGVQDGTPVFRG